MEEKIRYVLRRVGTGNGVKEEDIEKIQVGAKTKTLYDLCVENNTNARGILTAAQKDKEYNTIPQERPTSEQKDGLLNNIDNKEKPLNKLLFDLELHPRNAWNLVVNEMVRQYNKEKPADEKHSCAPKTNGGGYTIEEDKYILEWLSKEYDRRGYDIYNNLKLLKEGDYEKLQKGLKNDLHRKRTLIAVQSRASLIRKKIRGGIGIANTIPTKKVKKIITPKTVRKTNGITPKPTNQFEAEFQTWVNTEGRKIFLTQKKAEIEAMLKTLK
jgi:hypothetical protein